MPAPDEAMKTIRILPLAVGVLALGLASIARAEEAPTSRADLRAKLEELRGLPPEERRAKLREFTQNLTPAQRQEIQKLRENAGGRRPDVSSEQRAALQKRAETRLAGLEKKKADGSITEQETRQLGQLKKRLEAAKAHAAAKPAEPRNAPAAAKDEGARP
jgi:hypothetical protein